MTQDGIYLTTSTLSALSDDTRAEILSILTLGPVGDPEAHFADDEEGGPSDLSVAQTRKFLERCSEKTTSVLRFIASAPEEGFAQTDLLAAQDETDPTSLRAVWGGLTRRIRSVLGDPDAYLLLWKEEDDGSWRAALSPMTHRSLRKALGM